MLGVWMLVFLNSGLFMNILSCFSHTFAFSMTLGKILAVATRFTSVWLPLYVWLGGQLVHEFAILARSSDSGLLLTSGSLSPFNSRCHSPFSPTCLSWRSNIFIFVLVQTKIQAAFARTDDGYGHYLGIESVPFKVRLEIQSNKRRSEIHTCFT